MYVQMVAYTRGEFQGNNADGIIHSEDIRSLDPFYRRIYFTENAGARYAPYKYSPLRPDDGCVTGRSIILLNYQFSGHHADFHSFHSSAPSNLRTKIDAIANPMETRLTIDHISRVAWTRRMGL